MLGKILTQLSFILLDGIGIILNLLAAVILKFGFEPPRENLLLVTDYFYFILFTHLIFFLFCRLYRIGKHSSFIDILYSNFWVETSIILFLTVFFLILRTYGLFNYHRPDIGISRELMFYFWLLNIFYLSFWRWIYLTYHRKKGDWLSRTIIIGHRDKTANLIQSLESHTLAGYQVIDVIEPDNGIQLPNEQLESLIKNNWIQELIIAVNLSSEKLLEIIDICHRTSCVLWVYPNLYEVIIGRLQIREIAGIPLIELNHSPLSGWYQYGKRIMDIFVSLTGLIINTPLAILIAILIKIDSTGPVFYSQKRLGKEGKEFILYKFRTMYLDAEKITGAILATKNDPRITRVGRILRKMRLDELPQLYSILKGDMSMVGPRPERPELTSQYSKSAPHFQRRLAIRPGLTGLAQIQSSYDLDIESKLRYDLAYMYNVNLLLDLKILLATIKVVFTAKGAQ